MATQKQATQAQQLLDNEMLNTALDNIEKEVIALMKQANLNGTEDANAYGAELVRKLQTAAAFKKSLQLHIDNYKMASFNKE